jgi:hypothetical protein
MTTSAMSELGGASAARLCTCAPLKIVLVKVCARIEVVRSAVDGVDGVRTYDPRRASIDVDGK